MKLEIGKYYYTRNGGVVEITKRSSTMHTTELGTYYYSDGEYLSYTAHELDIISEVPEYYCKNGDRILPNQLYKNDDGDKFKCLGFKKSYTPITGYDLMSEEYSNAYADKALLSLWPETYTITIDGKDVELSEESFNALKDSLNK